jgi:hypothetical protein
MTFKTGTSGNPDGRPKGSGCRQKLFNEFITPRKEALVNKAIELALAGNDQMLRLLLERLLPPKPDREPIESIGILKGSLTKKGNKILSLMSNGEISLSEGNALMQAVSSQIKLLETDDIIKRIEQLEKSYAQKKSK